MLSTIMVLSVLAAEPIKASGCLAPKPRRGTRLATLQPNAVLSLSADGSSPVLLRLDVPSFIVCEDKTLHRIVGLGRGLAVLFYAKAEGLQPMPMSDAAWRGLRRLMKEEPQQVGCLKRLAAGTTLYERPAGQAVGIVLDGTHAYGKWESLRLGSIGWALLRVNLGFGPFEVWIKDADSERDWCPD